MLSRMSTPRNIQSFIVWMIVRMEEKETVWREIDEALDLEAELERAEGDRDLRSLPASKKQKSPPPITKGTSSFRLSRRGSGLQARVQGWRS